MRTLRVWLSRLLGAFGLDSSADESELAEELATHLDMETEELIRGGIAPDEARRMALIRAGGLSLAQDAYRAQRGLPAVEQLGQDLRFALRTLRRAPAFTTAVVLSLAIGIGATSAVFSVTERVLLRPLPYGEPGRIVMLWRHDLKTGDHGGVVSFPDYLDWISQSHTIERSAAFNGWTPVLTGTSGAEALAGSSVGADFFRVLGVAPMLGRTFAAGEDAPNGPRVVVISYSLWKRQFSADPTIVGKSITLNGTAYTVIGVMPAMFRDPEPLMQQRGEVWRGLRLGPSETPRGMHWLRAVARLKPGTTLEQAERDLDLVASRLAKAYPQQDANAGIDVIPMQEQVVGKAKPILIATLAAAACVLLIACANAATLMLARIMSRASELAVRSALGARRARILKMLSVECLTLAGMGGAIGLAIAWVTTIALRHFAPTEIPRANEIALDLPIVGVTVLITFAAAILFGLAPAIRSVGGEAAETLQGASSRHTGRGTLRRVALTIELALALVLLSSAGLLTKTLIHITAVPLGFSVDHVLSMQMTLIGKRYETPETQTALFRTLTADLERIPGVRAAAMTISVPATGLNDMLVGTFGTDLTGEANKPQTGIHYRVTSPHYRTTMQIRLLEGRDLSDADLSGTPTVALINKAAVKTFFPGIDPIGHRLFLNSFGLKSVEVVGVLDDIRSDGPMSSPEPEVYVPLAQQPWSFGGVVVRTQGSPGSIIPAVRRVVHRVDPMLAVSDLESMADVVKVVSARQRFYATLFASFAVVALLISVIGVYGLVAYLVSTQRREIAIRMALGAHVQDVIRGLMTNAAMTTFIGLVLGLVCALATTRVVASLLFEVNARDPGTLAAATAVLATIALIAAFAASLRATQIAPADVLRDS